ncbi:OmpA family protein [Aureisphaera galaxeae]|uniref:OmpA family protein n=1 Tax=Aureisphaera galaxeae TaxID=1538023 RepID=UPI00234FE199|nr:OmpA family protein [Aureisphaera galaxeae]MDC8005974.1 OmpA family protein [Aureisphaera galaxeae]
MRKYIFFFVAFLCITNQTKAQGFASTETSTEIAEATTEFTLNKIGDNGFKFETLTTGINSKYADYGSGLFMDKFISFSARKIGALSRKDPATNEPYTKLYCSDILENYDLTRPLLFSSILNKNENLGTVSFNQEGNVMYFTKNKDGDTQHFEMYRAELNPEKQGEWINITPLPFNSDWYSVENPHLSKDGKTLYFASNMPNSKGGFDIFKVDVKSANEYSEVTPIEGLINTEKDEKFPHLSYDQKFMFFSSKGHDNIGGYDVFKSRRTKKGYVTILNLGNTINTEKDEIAFVPATERIGYITSNKDGGYGNHDIYRITEYVLKQTVSGKALDFETGIPLANAEVKLIDTDGTEVANMITNEKGEFNFPISSFEYYTIVSGKEGFYKGSTIFNTDNRTPQYEADVTLKAIPAPIVVEEEKTYIKIDNILFDYDSARIKEISKITLNKVVATLKENPEVSVALGAHTDFRGNDAYNMHLSDRRAASAVKYLLSKGISKDRLTWKGYGESEPVIDCRPCTEAQHETNRRIEFIIVTETN